MEANIFKLTTFFDRNEQTTIVTRRQGGGGNRLNLDYNQFGYVPDVAQRAQVDPGNPLITTPPYFTDANLDHAQWFTTRSILNPLGRAGS
jgi:hypothetical protein